MNGNQEQGMAVDAAVRAVSITAVRKFRKPLVDYLISGLEDQDKWVRIMAAEILGRVGDPEIAGHLKPLLADHDRDLRIAGERSMAMILAPRTLYPVQDADFCDTCLIRLVASEAMEQLRIQKDPRARQP